MSLFAKTRLLLFPLLTFLAASQADTTVTSSEENVPEEPAPPAPTSEQPQDTLMFLNQDTLTGTLVQLNEKDLVWKHPDVETPIRFGRENLKHIELRSPAMAEESDQDLPQIELTNQDVIRGKLLGLKNGTLTLDTPAMGQIELDARMVRAILPQPGQSTFFQGPTSAEEWEMHNYSGGSEKWVFRNAALTASGRNQAAIMELDRLPDQYTISFDLEWKGALNFELGFWGNNNKTPDSSSYKLSLQSNYLRAYRNYKNLGRHTLGSQQIRQPLTNGKTQVTMHLDRKAKQMMLLLDGSTLGQWRDAFNGTIRGDRFMFYSQGNCQIRISRILVKDWDGKMPMDKNESGPERDQLVTVNGDEFSGTVSGIRKDILNFQSEFADIKVPMERVAEIRFNHATRATPRLMAGDVKVRSSSQEQITLNATSIKEGILSGDTETTGRLKVNLQYFDEIQFNPYDDRHAVKDDGW